MPKQTMPLLIRLMQLFMLCLCPYNALAARAIPEDQSAAVIIAYHRIGEDAYPDSNLRLEQFKAHLQALENGPYNIMPLPALIKAVKTGKPLPENTLAITFEGAYKSAFTHAMPQLIARKIPFSVFFAAAQANQRSSQYMNWHDLKSLKKYSFVAFGLLPAAYIHLYDQDQKNILAQINKARVAYRKHLNRQPEIFSYPFGEYSLAYKSLIAGQGFEAALGLHAGALSPASDFYALPRFSMTESYGDLERFEMISQALPLPVMDIEPQEPYLTNDQTHFGFTVTKALSAALSGLSCHISGQAPPSLEIVGQRRVELRTAAPVTARRTRLNCTLPAPKNSEDKPRWRWFSRLLVRAHD